MASRRVTPEAVLVARYNTPREDWLRFRQQGIGGSDALAVLGFDPYRTRMEVWLDKTGRPVDIETTDRMRWGTFVEETIGRWFAQETGLKIRRCGLLRNIERPWQQVSVDFLVEDGGILEIKNRSRFRMDEWNDDQVDDGAEAQGCHALAVTGLRRSWFAAQLGGEPPSIRCIERNEEFVADLTAEEADFWKLVEAGEPPALEGRASPRLVKRLFPDAVSGKIADVGDDVAAVLLEARAALSDESAAEARKNELYARAQMAAGDAEIIRHNGRVIATWKNGQGRRKTDFGLLEKDYPDAYGAAVSRTPVRTFLNKIPDDPYENETPEESGRREAA